MHGWRLVIVTVGPLSAWARESVCSLPCSSRPRSRNSPPVLSCTQTTVTNVCPNGTRVDAAAAGLGSRGSPKTSSKSGQSTTSGCCITIYIDDTPPRIIDLKPRAPDTGLQDLDLELRNSNSELQDLDSELRNAGSELRNLDSELQDVDLELRNVNLKLQNPDSKPQNVDSKLREVDSKLQNHAKTADRNRHPASAVRERITRNTHEPWWKWHAPGRRADGSLPSDEAGTIWAHHTWKWLLCNDLDYH